MTTTSVTPPKTVQRQRLRNRLIWLAILTIFLWAWFTTGLSLEKFFTGFSKSITFVVGTPERPGSGFFPPDFSRWQRVLTDGLLVTLKMAFLGTTMAAVLGLVLAPLAARNTSPHPVIYQLTRRVLDFMRGIDDFILALIFVAAVGLGPFPGIIALTIHTAGILAKLFSEGIELVDTGQVEAVRATGANAFQVFVTGIFPQVIPHMVSMTLYRFESNVRAATVLGLVGAGGIGFYLQESFRSFNFHAASAIIVIILMSVFLIDFASARIRARLT
jgi:phosphonate transport system permease protein